METYSIHQSAPLLPMYQGESSIAAGFSGDPIPGCRLA